MIHHSLRIVFLALTVLVAVGTEALPNLDRVIATQMEEVAARPSDPMVHNDLANLLVLAERMDEAESSYRRAKELDPSDSPSRFNLGLLLQQQERTDEAFEELSALIDIDPQHAWAHYQLGMLESDRGNRKGALAYYAKSFALDPALTFERNNPHIIDNDLATEAILRSSDYRNPAAKSVPRSYGEGARLRALMLEEEIAKMEEEAERMEDAKEKADEREAREAGSRQVRSSSGSGSPVRSATDVAPLPRGSAAADEYEDEEDDRVLRNEDLAGFAAAGQVRGESSAQDSERSASPRRGSGRALAPTGVDEQSRRDAIRERLSGRTSSSQERTEAATGRATTGSSVEERPTPTPRYRPSRRSTASLDLEIIEDGARGAF